MEALTLTCQAVGAATLSALLLWLAGVVFQKLRPARLLDRLHTRAVLITGCDSGFGHGLARRLDALGVLVFAGCLDPEGSGARRLAQECSTRLRVLPLDVTSDQQVADAVTAVRAALGGAELWAVVNNAGIADVGEIDNAPLVNFQRVLDVNTVGPIRVIKAFLPLLKISKGRVINVASPLGRFPLPFVSAYCMTKAALIMCTDVLRMELKKWSIAVSTVEPYLYKTPISDIDQLKAKFVNNLKSSPSIRRDSEEQEIQEIGNILDRLYPTGKSDISEVVEEMAVACVGRNVQVTYIPGLKEKIGLTIFTKFPDWLKELTAEMVMAFIKKSTATKGGLHPS